MGGFNYAQHIEHPQMIEVCTNCRADKCQGICKEYRLRWRQLFDRRNAEPITINDVHDHMVPMMAFGECHFLTEWAQISGIPYDVLRYRIKGGKATLEEAISKGQRRRKAWREPVRYEYNGRALSVREWSEVTGICKETIRLRIKRGWDMGRVLTTPAYG